MRVRQNLGEFNLIDTPMIGYATKNQVIVAGRVADNTTHVALSEDPTDAIEDRVLVLEIDVLNPTLCLVERVLANAPKVGVDVEFRVGPDNAVNSSGHYFVAENPVIDVVIPNEMKGAVCSFQYWMCLETYSTCCAIY